MKTAGNHNLAFLTHAPRVYAAAQFPPERSGGTLAAAAPLPPTNTGVSAPMCPRPADDGGRRRAGGPVRCPGRRRRPTAVAAAAAFPDKRTAPRQAGTLFPSGVLGEMLLVRVGNRPPW